MSSSPAVASPQENPGSSVREPTECPKKEKGLSMWTASIFVAGLMAGSGLLTLPHALSQSGWWGILLLLVCCFNSLYGGICIGHCWLILEERWSEYKDRCRNPYPTIASRAVAPWMSYIVSFCIDLALFGGAVVFLLISAQIIANIAKQPGLTTCHFVLILAAALWPLMWFGTPKDFWVAAVSALVSTGLASVLLLVAILMDQGVAVDEDDGSSLYGPPTVESFARAFATMMFAFGGVFEFPTFQNDMKKKQEFPRSACLGYTVLMVMYLPVAVCGYYVYGSSVDDNILLSLRSADGVLGIAVELLLAAHLFFAFLLVINAPAQEIEEFLRIPKKFGWKRCVLRSCMMAVVVFVALSVPKFGKILELVGATTITLTTFVFPPIFYLMLIRQKEPHWPDRSIPIYETIYLWFIVVIGVIGGAVATYVAIHDLIKDARFSTPCYVNMTVID